MVQQLPDAPHRALERALPADRVVGLRGRPVDAHPELERVGAGLVGRRQPGEHGICKQGSVREHGHGPAPEHRLQHRGQFRVHEGLSSGDVVLLDAVTTGDLEPIENGLQRHEVQGIALRAAVDEAVRAPKIADGSGHLEPQRVEMIESDRRPGVGGS